MPEMASSRAMDTFPRLLFHHSQERGTKTAMREKDLGIWQTWSWSEVAEQVGALACGLAEMGFKRGDNLAIIGDNRPRLYMTMAAVQCLGGVPVPLYQDGDVYKRQAISPCFSVVAFAVALRVCRSFASDRSD